MDNLSRVLMKAEVEGSIKGFHVGRGNFCINQIQLVDVTIMFSEFDNDLSFNHFLKVVETF